MFDRFLGGVEEIFRSRSPLNVAPPDGDVPSAAARSDHPPSPVNAPANQQQITGDNTIGDGAITAVKESLRLITKFSDGFPPLKMVAAGLVDIFDRIDVIKGAQTEATQLHEQVEKLGRVLEAYQACELPVELKDRLDGLHRALEEKRIALARKLDRSLATRIVFSTEDNQFLEQVLREISSLIEVTTFNMTVRNGIEIYDNTVFDNLEHVVGADFFDRENGQATQATRAAVLADLLSWATAADSSESSHVHWLSGMPGAAVVVTVDIPGTIDGGGVTHGESHPLR